MWSPYAVLLVQPDVVQSCVLYGNMDARYLANVMSTSTCTLPSITSCTKMPITEHY